LLVQLENLMQSPAQATQSAIPEVIDLMAESIHRRSLVVIFSDMFDNGTDTEQIFSALQHLKHNKHEVILFHVQDGKFEVDFDFENRPYEFIDMESGEKIRMNSNSLKEIYASKMKAFRTELSLKCGRFGIDIVDADINQGFEQVLLSYLIKRNKMI
jgi:uncharacterized protein (DUF58 family)